jgi:hypothetical protein
MKPPHIILISLLIIGVLYFILFRNKKEERFNPYVITGTTLTKQVLCAPTPSSCATSAYTTGNTCTYDINTGQYITSATATISSAGNAFGEGCDPDCANTTDSSTNLSLACMQSLFSQAGCPADPPASFNSTTFPSTMTKKTVFDTMVSNFVKSSTLTNIQTCYGSSINPTTKGIFVKPLTTLPIPLGGRVTSIKVFNNRAAVAIYNPNGPEGKNAAQMYNQIWVTENFWNARPNWFFLGPASRKDDWTTANGSVALQGEVIALNDAVVVSRGGGTDLRVVFRDHPNYPVSGGGPTTSTDSGNCWTTTDFMAGTNPYPAYSLNKAIAAVGDISTIVYPQILTNTDYTFAGYGSIRIGYNVKTQNQDKSAYSSATALTKIRDFSGQQVSIEPSRSMDMFNNTILYLFGNRLVYMKRLPLNPKLIDETTLKYVTLPSAVSFPTNTADMNSIKGSITIGPFGVTFLTDTKTIWMTNNVTSNSFSPTWTIVCTATEIGEAGVDSIYYKTIRVESNNTNGYLTFNGSSGNVYYYPFNTAGLTDYTL